MSKPVKINEDFYDEAKKIAEAECRTVQGQIEYWAQIGKCALDNPDLPTDFIQDVLVSKNTDRSLAEPFDFKDSNND